MMLELWHKETGHITLVLLPVLAEDCTSLIDPHDQTVWHRVCCESAERVVFIGPYSKGQVALYGT